MSPLFATVHNLVICSDEIHADLLLDPDARHIPMAALDPAVADRTITLMAPSKTYNIAGLGCSYAIIPNERLRQDFKRAMARIVPHINVLAYAAAIGGLPSWQALAQSAVGLFAGKSPAGISGDQWDAGAEDETG